MASGQVNKLLQFTIEASDTGERLVNVRVQSRVTGNVSYSDLYGLILIRAAKERDSLEITYFGYETSIISVTDLSIAGAKQAIQLDPAKLPEVLIRADKLRLDTGGDKVSMSSSEIREVPAILGEVDPMKAIAILPGISNSREGGAGIVVRGGAVSENIVLLDEAQLYNTNHLFGLLSTFNPDVVETLDVYKNYYSPEYADGLSSLIHVKSKEGDYKEHNQTLSLGIITSRLKLEGPLIKDKVSYVVAGRTSYLTLFMLPGIIAFRNRTGEGFFNYSMYDLNAKINFKLQQGGGIFYSFYRGRDYYASGGQNMVSNAFNRTVINVDYGNTVHSVRWIQPLSNSKLFLKSYVSFTEYTGSNAINSLYESQAENVSSEFTQRNSLQRLHARSKIQYQPNHAIELNIGMDWNWYSFDPINLINNSTNSGKVEQLFKVRRFSNALFSEVLLKLPYDFKAGFGLRYTWLRQGEYFHQYPEPRATLTKAIGSSHLLKFSYANLVQTIHGVINRNSFTGLDNWLPATEELPASRSQNFSLTYHYSNQKKSEWSASVFYRNWNQLVDVSPGTSFFIVREQGWENNFIGDGIGLAYGVELLYKTIFKNSKLQIGYTWMQNRRKFDAFNQGLWFPANFERRHDLSCMFVQKINDNWAISGLLTIASGAPFVAPTGARYDEDGNVRLIFSEVNNDRLPTYHRIDVSATRTLKTTNGNTTELSFGAYNVYNRLNKTSFYFIELGLFDENNQFVRSILNAKSLSFLPIIPHISWTYRF